MYEHGAPEQPDTNDKVVLLDIDGTLIDGAYKVTDSLIYEAVGLAIEQDWVLGLSSDSPYEAMQYWLGHFGLNGPIITEKGAQVILPQEDPNHESNYFIDLRDNTIEYFTQKGMNIWQGDPASLIRNSNRLPMPVDVGETVLLVNAFRRHSFGYFVRVIGEDGGLHISASQTQTIADEVRSLYSPDILVDEDLNHEHGLMIVSTYEMHKRIGSLVLMERLGVNRLSMVGNSKADYIGSDIAKHLAVGDAHPEFKELSDYIATRPVTGGAAQAILSLLE